MQAAKTKKKKKEGESAETEEENGERQGGRDNRGTLALMGEHADVFKGKMIDGVNFLGAKAAELLEKKDWELEYERMLNEAEINLEAFEQMLICMHIDLGPLDDDDYEKKLQELFERYDKDKSGSVNFRELRRAWIDLCDVEKELEKLGIKPKTSKYLKWGLKQYVGGGGTGEISSPTMTDQLPPRIHPVCDQVHWRRVTLSLTPPSLPFLLLPPGAAGTAPLRRSASAATPPHRSVRTSARVLLRRTGMRVHLVAYTC